MIAAERQTDDGSTIAAFFQRDLVEAELFLPWEAQKMRGEIFATCKVLEERADGERVPAHSWRGRGREAPVRAIWARQ